MNRILKREMGEYAKTAVSMLVGMVFMVYLEWLWVAHHHYFCVPRGTAAEKARMEEFYQKCEVNPINEFAGLGEGEWAK